MIVGIARGRSKTLKKKREIKRKNEKISNNTLLTFTFLYRKIHILLENISEKKLIYTITLEIQFSHVEEYWKCSNTNAHIDIDWFCRRHTSIQKRGNRLGILT